MSKLVIWGAGRSSYLVLTFLDGECIEEYRGGNAPWASEVFLHPNDKDALPLSAMRRCAEITAWQTVEDEGAEYGGEDEDTTNELLEDDARLCGEEG